MLASHVRHYSRAEMSKSHENTSKKNEYSNQQCTWFNLFATSHASHIHIRINVSKSHRNTSDVWIQWPPMFLLLFYFSAPSSSLHHVHKHCSFHSSFLPKYCKYCWPRQLHLFILFYFIYFFFFFNFFFDVKWVSVQNILLTWHLNSADDAILVVEGPLGFLVSISGPQKLLPQLSLTIALSHQLPVKIYKKE